MKGTSTAFAGASAGIRSSGARRWVEAWPAALNCLILLPVGRAERSTAGIVIEDRTARIISMECFIEVIKLVLYCKAKLKNLKFQICLIITANNVSFLNYTEALTDYFA